ncbi:Cyclic di-GMP phosphodiesterase YfgF [Vibrio vulnificus]|nr:Cyclic di-GMP phosphodiesterase YfgF [Vibrio vulnificus]
MSTWIIEKAHQYQVPLDKICFEVTESSALQNEEQAIETLKVLRAAGCKIALDDFGTGYASFAYLRRLPLDIVKIDGEFIKDLPTNETDRLIVESISNVANDIGLETVAEFVESEQHVEMLKQWHITYAQGFGVYKPQPLAQVLREFEASSVV